MSKRVKTVLIIFRARLKKRTRRDVLLKKAGGVRVTEWIFAHFNTSVQ